MISFISIFYAAVNDLCGTLLRPWALRNGGNTQVLSGMQQLLAELKQQKIVDTAARAKCDEQSSLCSLCRGSMHMWDSCALIDKY